MLRVVVNKHVVGHCQHVAIYIDGSGHHHLWRSVGDWDALHKHHESPFSVSYLESPHVSRVSGIFQTVLIALEEKLQEESGKTTGEQEVSLEAVNVNEPGCNDVMQNISIEIVSKKQEY